MDATEVYNGIANAVEMAKPAQEYCLKLLPQTWRTCMTKAEWSGWMQAVFSVFAIFVAIAIAAYQSHKARIQYQSHLNENIKSEMKQVLGMLDLSSRAMRIAESNFRLRRTQTLSDRTVLPHQAGALIVDLWKDIAPTLKYAKSQDIATFMLAESTNFLHQIQIANNKHPWADLVVQNRFDQKFKWFRRRVSRIRKLHLKRIQSLS